MLLSTIISIVAIGMVIYHVLNSFLILGGPTQIENIHLAFALVLVFLAGMQKSSKLVGLKTCFVLLSVLATGYIAIFFDDLTFRMGFPGGWDLIIGAILILVCLEGTRQSFGYVIPVIVIVYISYAFFGYLLPEPFQTMQFRPDRLLSRLTILQGIYGLVLGISAKYVFLFVIFGATLESVGGTRFFKEIGRLIGTKMKGGAGMAALVTSGLLGMVSGSVTGNVATTGSFTIPTMKLGGYKPYQAAAIEATASTGGMIMPPVMAGTAFIMSGFTGIPYVQIMAASAIPALLYYFSGGLYILFQGRKMNLTTPKEEVDIRELLENAPIFFVPLLALIILMVLGYSPMYAVSRTLIILVILGFIRKKTRPSLKQLIEGFTNGAITGARVGVLLALINLVISISIMTGLGVKLPAAMEAWSGGNLTVALILTAVIALILGMGMDVAAVYVLVGMIAAPVLIKMGLSVLQAHMFVFYFGVMSFVTPPVAIAALVASPIAGAPFFKTSLEASKIAIGGFLIPFLFITTPVIVLLPQSPLSAAIGLIATIVILIALQIVICGHYITRINLFERGVSVSIVVILLSSLAMKNYILFSTGMIMFILLNIVQYRKSSSLIKENTQAFVSKVG